MAMAARCKHTLTYEEFESYAKEISAISERLGDGWELRSMQQTDDPKKTVFLVKKCIKLIKYESAADPDDARELELQYGGGLEAGIEDCSDPAATAQAQSMQNDPASLSITQPRTVHLEYHAIYSLSYEVPILYFTATYDNGRQLPLQEIWHHLVSHVHSSGETDRRGLVTQQEHPLLGRPFYHIHPCHTAEVMANAVGLKNGVTVLRQKPQDSHSLTTDDEETSLNSKNSRSYLLTWLSTFGPLVGLNIPLAYEKFRTVD